jgi:hypothetical protein
MAYTYRNTRAIEIKNSVSLAVKGQPDITKNRILAIVGVFELLNFYFQYDAWKSDIKDKPELSVQLVGSMFSVSAVAFDMLGESWGRKTINGAAASAAAFRLTAGSLGILGGIAGLYSDKVSYDDSSSLIVKRIILIRMAANLAVLVGQAGVLASAVIQYTEIVFIKRALTKFTSNALVAFLMGARVVAGLNLLTLGLISVEILLKKYILDDAMKDWCQKTAFKLVSDPKKESIFKSASRNEKKFKNADEEYEEFMKAIVSV